MNSGGQHADAIGRAGEQRRENRDTGERFDETRLDMLLQERREHKKAPNPVNDRGNPGQKLDRDADRPSQPMGQSSVRKIAMPRADRHRDDHGDERGDERPVDRRHRAELFGDRIPRFRPEKVEPEGLEGRNGTRDQRSDHPAKEQKYRPRRGQCQNVEHSVA